MAFNWSCPYCYSKTTINSDTYSEGDSYLTIKNSDGNRYLKFSWIVCPNVECKRLSLYGSLFEYKFVSGKWQIGNQIKQWNLLPDTKAKIFPEYIPGPIKQDYEEAYAISELSPKASATLSRRCLQGIIRDFWGISKGRLIDEINAIENKVDPLTWKSIDAIRKVGNIGAHMEKDINLIIDVDPSEAIMLLQLIELLFVEWYVHRHERELRLNSIIQLAEDKDNSKKK